MHECCEPVIINKADSVKTLGNIELLLRIAAHIGVILATTKYVFG